MMFFLMLQKDGIKPYTHQRTPLLEIASTGTGMLLCSKYPNPYPSSFFCDVVIDRNVLTHTDSAFQGQRSFGSVRVRVI